MKKCLIHLLNKFRAFLSFYGIEIESVDSLLDSANNMTKKQSSFTERLKRKDSCNRSTFRKGVPNEYENTFSKSHFQIFDDYAGDLLKRCSYKDHNNFERVSI